MTGGTVVVGGKPGNRFGYDLDDRTHPAVLVAYCSMKGYLPEDSIRNGLILLLNKDVEREPELMRFRNGVKEVLAPTIAPNELYDIIRAYALEWKEAHAKDVPAQWT